MSDISLSPQLKQALPIWKANFAAFWNDNTQILRYDTVNALGTIYDKIHDSHKANTVIQAFSTTAIYLIGQEVLKHFDYKTLSGAALDGLVQLVLDGCTCKHPREVVQKNIQKHYGSGSRWHAYARALTGYGSFFFLPDLPMST